LSIPKLEEVVERATAVRVEGFDPEGRPVSIEAGDLFARALQHEIDHLDGLLFLDRITPLKRRLAMRRWHKLLAEEQKATP
jgi:peptide deformylase